jgi:hypothetical protein
VNIQLIRAVDNANLVNTPSEICMEQIIETRSTYHEIAATEENGGERVEGGQEVRRLLHHHLRGPGAAGLDRHH